MLFLLRFFYNLFLPIGLMFYLPGLIYKYFNRGGWKGTFNERFGFFSARRKQELEKFHGAIWFHSVSVGETMIALSMIKSYSARYPEQKFIISTTTTTGQELARSKATDNTIVIFCPIDFIWIVKKTYKLLKPSLLAIFETELWPNLIFEAKKENIPLVLVNGRMSDHSVKGYRRAAIFFGPLLKAFDYCLVQSQIDGDRYLQVSPDANVIVTGNLKFDQKVPENIPDAQLDSCFGPEDRRVILAASTHSGEEELIIKSFMELLPKHNDIKLVLIPRHAERGNDIAAFLKKENIPYARRSTNEVPATPVNVLLADTTGEMFKYMSKSDIVIMGKSLAGHDEGHNLIEPALLGKAIVTGNVLRNFRYILDVLVQADALLTVAPNEKLADKLDILLMDREYEKQLGVKALETISQHKGAADKTCDCIAELLNRN